MRPLPIRPMTVDERRLSDAAFEQEINERMQMAYDAGMEAGFFAAMTQNVFGGFTPFQMALIYQRCPSGTKAPMARLVRAFNTALCDIARRYVVGDPE